jgi:CBS domain-containing protein
MTPIDALPPVSPDADAALALLELAQRKAEQLPVVEGGEVRGIVRREDILRWLSLYGHRGLAR